MNSIDAMIRALNTFKRNNPTKIVLSINLIDCVIRDGTFIGFLFRINTSAETKHIEVFQGKKSILARIIKNYKEINK